MVERVRGWFCKSKEPKNNDMKFFAHTPIDAVKNIVAYKCAIDFVFDNDNVHNVAISGSYGSGKSSVLATYKKDSTKKFLHISLAHFRPSAEADNAANTSPPSITTQLEGKILNQLLHQIPYSKIKRTNFRVTEDRKKWYRIFATILFMPAVILGLYTSFFQYWTTFVESLTLNWRFIELTTRGEARLLAGALLLGFLAFLLYHLIKLQENRSFIKKASISGVEIEMCADNADSYFDKYLNEVLYLFSKIKADVIVFEDIDRFKSSLIFERLHEINILVNIKRKKTLRFFYLLRDDIFCGTDRLKFFDFIIPIIPVVNTSNSYNKFINCFVECGIKTEDESLIDLDFLQELSAFIGDMRLLQNICNEFLVYWNGHQFERIDHDPNKLFALIAYKNLFPKDFSDLQLERGFMFEIIGGNGKTRLIEVDVKRLQQIIVDKSTELEAVTHETALADELAIVHWNKIAVQVSNRYNPPVYSIIAQECIQKIESMRNQSRNDATLASLIAEYDRRATFCAEDETKRAQRIAGLEREIADARSDFATLNERRLRDIITPENIDAFLVKLNLVALRVN